MQTKLGKTPKMLQLKLVKMLKNLLVDLETNLATLLKEPKPKLNPLPLLLAKKLTRTKLLTLMLLTLNVLVLLLVLLAILLNKPTTMLKNPTTTKPRRPQNKLPSLLEFPMILTDRWNSLYLISFIY